MRKILFTMLGLLWGFSLNAQDYTPKWGPVYEKEGGAFSWYQFWGFKGDYYYLLMRPGSKNNLLKYDRNHKLVAAQAQKFEVNKKKIELTGFAKTSIGDFGIFNFFNKKQKEWKVFTSPFVDGEFGTYKEVFSRKFEGLYDFRFFRSTSPRDEASANLAVSEDRRKVVFVNLVRSTGKDSQDELVISVFDENMNSVWSKVRPFEFPEEKITFKEVKINKEGIVFLLAWVEKENRKGTKDLPEHDFRIYRMSENEIEEYDVQLGNEIAPTNIGFFLSKEQDAGFIIAGFYTKLKGEGRLAGVFCGNGNREGFQNIKTHPFEDAFLEGLVSEKAIEENEGLSWNFDIDKFIQFGDGTVGFLAEYFAMKENSYTDSKGQMRINYYFKSNSIILPRFKANGDLVNIQKIEKYFMSGIASNTSYSYALNDNKIYLLFNNFKDKEERTDAKGKKAKARWRYTDLVVLNIETGEIEFNETLFNNKDIELEFTPRLSSYGKDQLLIGSSSGKKYSFGTIDLK